MQEAVDEVQIKFLIEFLLASTAYMIFSVPFTGTSTNAGSPPSKLTGLAVWKTQSTPSKALTKSFYSIYIYNINNFIFILFY